MDRSSDIIAYLSRAKGFERVVIAPNAPPVSRCGTVLAVAVNKVLDASDVADTLKALYERGGTPLTRDLPKTGAFAFGVRDAGRFRVHYLTQRGSRVVSITRIPAAHHMPEEICDDSDLMGRLVHAARRGGAGMLAITGPNLAANSTLAYAILRAVNVGDRHVIYVMEPELTFLMQHENSIVIQTELGNDIDDIQEGLRTALRFDADLIFVGGIDDKAALPALRRAFLAGIFIIASTSTLAAAEILQGFAPLTRDVHPAEAPPFRGCANVSPLSDGKVHVSFTDQTGS